MEESQEQTNNTRPWLWRKGQSGNPGGRPVGSKSMKSYVQERFLKMTDEEKEEFLDGLNKIDLFKMAEGNPQSDVTTKGEAITVPPDRETMDLDKMAMEIAKKIKENE